MASPRCPSCRLPVAPVSHCICGAAPRLRLATRLALIVHAREWRRLSNTGRLIQLAVAETSVRLHGLAGAPPGAAAADLDPTTPGLWVLFPGRGARPLADVIAAGRPARITLVVPDGNWTQSKHMMSRLPALAHAQAVALTGPQPGATRLRRNRFGDRMSTFEAVAQALGILEGADVEARLNDFYRVAVDRMLMLRGKLKASEVYRGPSLEVRARRA